VFALGSAASALASSPGQLIAARALTGVGAAFIYPATLSLLTNIFTSPVERQRAIAIWAAAIGVGTGIGPVVGGLLLRSFYWGSVFWVNVPVCLLAVIGGRLLIPTSRDPNRSPMDPPGLVLSVIGLSALVYAVVEGPERGWASPQVAGGFAVAAVVLAVFVAVELRSTHPMLDVRLFANPRFGAASLALTAMFFCLTGVIFLQTLHLQFLLGFDPLGAGLRTAPASVVMLFVSPLTPRLVRALGTRAVCFTGLLIAAVAVAVRGTFSVHTHYDAIFISHCHDHGSGHRVDHGRGGPGPGRGRLGRQRHHPPGRRRPRRGGHGQRGGLALSSRSRPPPRWFAPSERIVSQGVGVRRRRPASRASIAGAIGRRAGRRRPAGVLPRGRCGMCGRGRGARGGRSRGGPVPAGEHAHRRPCARHLRPAGHHIVRNAR
jgi:MFS family permease